MNLNSARNLTAGFLWVTGTLAFLGGSFLLNHWARTAPHTADPTRGLVYLRNWNDHFGYFSAFQITSVTLLMDYPIPLAMLGAVIMPKKNEHSMTKGPLFHMSWDSDDPKQLRRWGTVGGGLFAVVLFWRLGPALVETLNAHVIVFG
jgi:hypothetical protein